MVWYPSVHSVFRTFLGIGKKSRLLFRKLLFHSWHTGNVLKRLYCNTALNVVTDGRAGIDFWNLQVKLLCTRDDNETQGGVLKMHGKSYRLFILRRGASLCWLSRNTNHCVTRASKTSFLSLEFYYSEHKRVFMWIMLAETMTRTSVCYFVLSI